ncbi:phosphotransferase [Diaminobutyricimonas sp. TR449]|uniref:phosphotransferase n=1 Tax=Diaminobutyricimonas sp. TR449 TaxID=2708076 RepID=UPI0014226E58|nr:phosphotransferase [Diaminobutyricimonas sp. TR449]
MARSHLTLAALATAAVADLDVARATAFGSNSGGDFSSALLTGRDGRDWVIRMPRNPRAEAEQSADLVALRALSPGVRARLPFAVSTFAGQVPFQGSRAVVYEYVHGDKVPLQRVDPTLAASIGRAIAAIHQLPTTFVTDAGLPTMTAVESLRATLSIIDRASATGLVPALLQSRWEAATDDHLLWQFQPTVINGELSAESILSAGDAVSGVLGWQELRIGDPAKDLCWLLSAPTESADAALDAYMAARGGTDRQLKHRAVLYAELELARWLLHGTEVRDTSIVDDAVAMLHGLVDRVQNDVMNPISPQTMPTPTVSEVEALLDAAERRTGSA